MFVFIQNTPIYKIQVKQMVFYVRFPDYSSSLNRLKNRPIKYKSIYEITQDKKIPLKQHNKTPLCSIHLCLKKVQDHL